jgi:hypothetical protein
MIDSDKIVDDILALFYPIMVSLGVKTMKTTSTQEHLTNIIDFD